MKNFRLRKWTEILLIIIAFISFMIMGSECDNTITFIISHIMATVIFVISIGILNEYSR